MIDPKTILDGLRSFQISVDIGGVCSSLISLMVLLGISKLVRYFQRGKRLGAFSVPIEIVRTRSWIKKQMSKIRISDKTTEKIGTGIAVAIFLCFCYLGLDRVNLPFKPITTGIMALIATGNLLLLSNSRKGVCISFENGLLIEGNFYSFEKIHIERNSDMITVFFGKSRFIMQVSDFENNKRRINDLSIHIKYECTLNEKDSKLTSAST